MAKKKDTKLTSKKNLKKAEAKKLVKTEQVETKPVDAKASETNVKEVKVAEEKVAKLAVEKEVKATKEKATKTAVDKEVKVVEEKAEKATTDTEVKKIAAKPQPKKLTTAKEPKKIATKAQPKKQTEKEEKKETKVVEKKEPAKKAVKTEKVKKTSAKAKAEIYNNMTLQECIEKMHAMNVRYSYEDYVSILFEEADKKKIVKNIMEGNHIADLKLDFDRDGYDEDLILITLCKVGETMDIRAEDFKDMEKEVARLIQFKYTDDPEQNAQAYLDTFHMWEKVLMVAQRKQIHDCQTFETLLKIDTDAFLQHFMKLAYTILPSWQYNDVVFYEDFIYTILSQYDDLYAKYQLEALLDCADLYIKFHDYQRGDEAYGYILRENEIKDYIYYRFAHVYESIDLGKAKALAYESFQYVDGRYDYYPKIMEIVEK